MQIFRSPETSLPTQTPRLWERCVFVDWHGVLCQDVFWHSILDNPRHQLRGRLAEATEQLFRTHISLVADWMRGVTDSAHVVETLDVELFHQYHDDYLLRRLRQDCARMSPQAELLESLRTLQGLNLIVVATDNMDCFAHSVGSIAALHDIVDAVACSSEIGVLKAEDPERFFGPVLERHDLRPDQAMLIDDSAANCARFEEWGGTAVHFTDTSLAINQLRDWLTADIEISAPHPHASPSRGGPSSATTGWSQDW
jgi:FMN phosphatase YigB (HAD superfamily)